MEAMSNLIAITIVSIFLLLLLIISKLFSKKKCPICKKEITKDNLWKLDHYERFTCNNCKNTIYEK